jgi:hypothetical protein
MNAYYEADKNQPVTLPYPGKPQFTVSLVWAGYQPDR